MVTGCIGGYSTNCKSNNTITLNNTSKHRFSQKRWGGEVGLNLEAMQLTWKLVFSLTQTWPLFLQNFPVSIKLFFNMFGKIFIHALSRNVKGIFTKVSIPHTLLPPKKFYYFMEIFLFKNLCIYLALLLYSNNIVVVSV